MALNVPRIQVPPLNLRWKRVWLVFSTLAVVIVRTCSHAIGAPEAKGV